MSWHYVSAAVIGTLHFSEGTPCLEDCLADVVVTPDDEILIAVAAEGAGAGVACESFFAAAASWLRSGGAIARLTRADAEQWVRHTNRIVAAIAGTRAAAFLQIGIGAIVVASDGPFARVFPRAARDAMQFEVRAAAFEDFAVMTNGLQRIDASLFVPLLETLRRDEPGYAGDLEPELVALLVSNAVNEQTRDDKTLILATRGESP